MPWHLALSPWYSISMIEWAKVNWSLETQRRRQSVRVWKKQSKTESLQDHQAFQSKVTLINQELHNIQGPVHLKDSTGFLDTWFVLKVATVSFKLCKLLVLQRYIPLCVEEGLTVEKFQLIRGNKKANFVIVHLSWLNHTTAEPGAPQTRFTCRRVVLHQLGNAMVVCA